MSLLSQLHDLKLAMDQFRPNDVSPEEEQRIAHTAAKLVAMLDHVSSRNPRPAQQEEPESETLLSIARQYGVRVADLRKHNAHLQHYDDSEPLPRNTPVKIKSNRGKNGGSDTRSSSVMHGDATQLQIADRSSIGGAGPLPVGPLVNQGRNRIVFDTIRSIAKDQNVTIDALLSANRVLQKFDVDEPLPQDLDIVIPAYAPPAQRTYVLTFAGETVRSVADTVAHCRPDDLLAANPQLGSVGLDTRLPEGTRIALPR